MTARECLVCGRPLEGRQRMFCSSTHKAAYHRDADAATAAYSENPPERACAWCGDTEEMRGKRSDARFCSPQCRTQSNLQVRQSNGTQAYTCTANETLSAVRAAASGDREAERFWMKVAVAEDRSPRGFGECWVWTASLTGQGYGQFHPTGIRGNVGAHRWSFEDQRGPIPAGFEVDHLCGRRNCVNPEHLHAVAPLENKMRGNSPTAINARKTHCVHGHPLSGDNLYAHRRKDGTLKRECRTCRREANRRVLQRHPDLRLERIAYLREYRQRKRKAAA